MHGRSGPKAAKDSDQESKMLCTLNSLSLLQAFDYKNRILFVTHILLVLIDVNVVVCLVYHAAQRAHLCLKAVGDCALIVFF